MKLLPHWCLMKVRYLVGPNERVHSQVVLNYFLCHV